MILYFADRKMNILGCASTTLNGKKVSNDLLTEDVDSNVSSLTCDIFYDSTTRIDIQNMTSVGNFVFRYDDNDDFTEDNKYSLSSVSNFFTIIETEEDTSSQSINIYSEDAGLDLINDLAFGYSSNLASAADCITYFVKDSGFHIRNDEIIGVKKPVAWEGSSTVTERINDICSIFDCEIAYGFDIEGLSVIDKWIDIFKKRGNDNGEILTINRNLSRIVVKKSITNLATALYPTGANGLTLDDYPGGYDDGDFYISGGYLYSRNALAEWARYPFEKDFSGHINRAYSCEAINKTDLKDKAIEELKKIREPEINYDVDIIDIPFNIGVGDRINIVDDEGEIYVSGRVLKLETSVSNYSKVVTLGEYLIKSSGIADKVQKLAEDFSKIAKNRQFYIWIAYSDSPNPLSSSEVFLEPLDHQYIGVLPNQIEELESVSQITPDKLSSFKWSKIGSDGSDAISIEIDSSEGLIFKDTIRTALTAVVKVGITRITNQSDLEDYFGEDAEVIWYNNDEYYGTGFTLINVVSDTKMNFKCQLAIGE